MRKTIIVLLFLLNFNFLNAQVYHYPVSGKSNEDFSSAYGSRDKGSNASEYIYDWHAGIDIAGSGNDVVPVLDGTVIHIQGTNNNQAIFVRHTDDLGTFVVEYKHVFPIVSVNDAVYGGTPIASIADDHLDIRYFDGISTWAAVDYPRYTNTSHPWAILGTGGDFYSVIKVMEDQNYELYSGGRLSLKESDDGLGNYFEFALRVDQNELDIEFLRVDVWGWTS